MQVLISIDRHVIRKIVFSLILIITSISTNAEAGNYQIFDNYRLSNEAVSVRFFIQDSKGLIWLGTNEGLYNFDGYTAYPHYTHGTQTNNTINCGLQYNDSLLLLGFETGPMLYDLKNDKYELFITGFYHDVRSMALVDNELWMGCIDGLFVYNLDTKGINELLRDNQKGINHEMVYALLEDEGYIYFGTSNDFGRYSLETKKYEPLGFSAPSTNFFITALMKDNVRNCIWIGRGFSLLKYDIESNILIKVGEFNVVKSMAVDHDNNIIMGTDNGLYIYDGTSAKYIVHDSRAPWSLSNNVIWSVYKDEYENIWMGTDNGISLSPKNRRINLIPIYDITGTGEGNQFYSILRDSKDNLWFGGTNGLILSQDIAKFTKASHWYKMDESRYHISHNRIRDIFEDNDQNLWIATDYGINRLDEKSKKFLRYSIYAPEGTQNANWAYDILEDSYKRLWVATFNSGIFVIDKKKLMSSKSVQVADIHYTLDNGLSGNNVDFIVFDKNENVWALVHKKGINFINSTSGEISNFPIKEYTGGAYPGFLMSDMQGFIWVGYLNGTIRIDPDTKEVKNISFNSGNNAEVLAMTKVKNSIWVSTTDGLWIINAKDFTTRQMHPVNHVFTSMYYDESRKMVVLGSVDALALSRPQSLSAIQTAKIIISAIYVNNQRYNQHENTPEVSYLNEIKLEHNQNNIKIEVSDLSYTKEKSGTFIYKLNEDDNWTTLPYGQNSIQLNKLKPGTYNLSISILSLENENSQSLKNFSIIVTPPWYETILAKIVYIVFIFVFLWWIYFFITAKNNMKFEQIEKEKNLQQSKLKIAFFSDVAHEFKTPLSLIIAPMSRLIQGTKNEKERNALEMVHQNAMKLNSLIHQAIDYYRDDSKVNIGLILSKVELVEFAQSIFLTYKESMKDKQIEFIFNTNAEQIFLNIDIVKIESVFNNLLTNACKFTNSGESIIFSIEYYPQDNGVEIKVSDTGSGIAEKDIPYIFQRFYQSQENAGEHEGTGIGLFIVKNYVEMHNGKVNVISEMDEGTTFTIWLPVIISNVENQSDDKESLNISNDKQLIVIVEDNVAIAEFIYNTFVTEYRCIIAHNGKTGLKACMELNPDIIIADVMMPVMDGLAMADRLKHYIPTSTIPLVLLTAKDDKETELKSIELNIDAFIAKPFDSIILYSRVKQILDNRKLLEKKVRIEHIASPKNEYAESLDEKFLTKITKIVEDKIADPALNVNMLCKLTDISSKQLYRKVKYLTGMTAVDYIKSIRMKKAAMYLTNKNFTIAEVMYMVGFSNHSYFAKCFQASFGKSPRQYMEEQKKMI